MADTKFLQLEKEKHNRLKDSILDLSFYTACTATISIAESLIPRPLPFLKIGLANIMLMLLIMRKKKLFAFLVLLGKVLLTGVFVGTILLPTTLIALGSGIVSLTLMIFMSKFKLGLSWIGISIISASVHNVMQLIVVRLILIYSNSIFELTPLMLILGVVTGSLTGVIAVKLDQKLPISFNKDKIYG